MSKIRAAAEMMKNLPGRGQDISKQVLGNPGRRQEMMGRNIPGRGAPGGLAGSLRPIPRGLPDADDIAKVVIPTVITGNMIALASLPDSMFRNPEELGRQAARAKISLQEMMDKLRGKAEELGESSQIYMLKIQSGYQDEMNNQEPQRIYDEDIDGGAKPVSLLMAGGGEAINSMVQQTQQIMNNLGMDVAQDTKIIKNAFGLSDPMMAANILQKTFKNKYPNLKDDDINNLINYGHEAFSREASKNFSNGGEASFPDLNNDGETTYADVLVGRGVKFAEGGEAIDSELAGMQMSEEDAMSEVASLDNPEMKMIEQLIAVVQQLMAQGVGEQEIKMFLKEQGLDDEDINTLFEMLSESDMQQQGAGQIDQQLQGMM